MNASVMMGVTKRARARPSLMASRMLPPGRISASSIQVLIARRNNAAASGLACVSLSALAWQMNTSRIGIPQSDLRWKIVVIMNLRMVRLLTRGKGRVEAEAVKLAIRSSGEVSGTWEHDDAERSTV